MKQKIPTKKRYNYKTREYEGGTPEPVVVVEEVKEPVKKKTTTTKKKKKVVDKED